jgi:hypothetical protein
VPSSQDVTQAEPSVRRLAAEFAGDLGIGAGATKELRIVYFDTPEHDLHAATSRFGCAARMAAGSRQ